MSSSSQTSAQRRARLAARRQTVLMMNVNEEQLYKFVLRAAYIAYLLEPETQAKLHPPETATSQAAKPVAPKHTSSASSAFGMLDLLRDSPNTRDSKSNKFPKELVQILRDKLQNVFMGREPKYQDQLVRATFGAFFNHYVEPQYFKQVKENRKIEELILIFYSKATAELKKRTTDDEWRSLVDQHVALFIRMILDCMKEHNLSSSAPELTTRLAGYESKLLSGTKEVLEPEVQSKSTQDSTPEISYHVKDMYLVQMLGTIFQKPESTIQKDIDHLRVLVSEQTALQDLKTYMKDLNLGNPPSLRPSDFPDEISYEDWKYNESKAITELMVKMIQSNPLLAKSEPTEVLSSLLSESAERPDIRRTTSNSPPDQLRRSVDVEQLNIVNGRGSRPDILRKTSAEEKEDFVSRSSYTFIPEDPRAYYKRLLEFCLKAQKSEAGEALIDEENDGGLFFNSTLALLQECAVRWRVHPASRVSLLLEVVRQFYDHEELGIEDINEAFSMADNFDYSSWPTADKLLLARVLVTIHETLLRDLYNILQRVFDPKPLNPKPVLVILNQYIYGNPLFNETEKDLTNYISDLEIGIKNRAIEIYNERREQFYDEPLLDLIHVHDYAEGFINDIERIHKRFKDPILGRVDILQTAVDTFVPLLFEDLQRVLIALVHKSNEDGAELPTEDMFAIYHKIKEAWDLYRQIVRKELGFDLKTLFTPAVTKWLEVTDAKTIEWVERAVHTDTLQPDNDELKQSSSAMDLFQFIGEAVEFLKKLEWPDEVQNAKFATFLARTVDKALGQYCMMMEHGFSEEMNAQEELSNRQNAQEGWMGRIKGAMAADDKAEPFQFKPQSLVRLNNIQYSLLKLDALQNNINVERLAKILELHAPAASKRNEKQNYIFTIKVVSAEDLKACDVNGLSDPYVVLSDEHGRRVAKTRTIWGDLNPRWDETFDVSTTGSLWLAATVWDRDRLVKNHDLCGRCYLKLDPGFFGDYLPRDYWLDLDTQGKLLLRVSMEGEKDDIQFYFGRAFRALKRAENDMTRKIVETMTTFSRHRLSLSVVRSLLTTTSSQKLSNWLGRTKLSGQAAAPPPKQGLTDEEIEKAIHPLFDYYGANFSILDESLSKVASVIVMGKLWKAVLGMFEDLLLPPLSDKPSRMQQLSEREVDIIYKWLIFIRNYFHAEGDGVPMDVLTSLKYNDILSVRFFYDETTENLIRESARIADAAYERQEKQSSRAAQVSFSLPKSVLKYRSLGTIKLHKAKKRDAKQKDPNDDIILRILRMRPGSEHYLRDRFRQKNRLAATVAAEGVLRAPRR